MISKSILRYMEPLEIPWPAVEFNSYLKRVPNVPLTDAAELAEYVMDLPKVGDLVMSNTYAMSTGLPHINSVSVVLRVETEVDRLRINHQGTYETHFLVNLLDSNRPWSRWAAHTEFKPLTEEQRKGVVDVVVQNRIERLIRHAEANFN